VLNDNRNIRLEHRRKVGIARNRRRFREIVKAQMQRAPRRYRNPVGADRIAVGKEDGERNVRDAAAGVENAGGLVRNKCAVGKGTLRRNGPSAIAQRLRPMASMVVMSSLNLLRGGRRTLTALRWFRNRNFWNSLVLMATGPSGRAGRTA
jgi:hypothetical protein